MKKFLTFLALACFMVTGAWAQWTPPFVAADSYENITHWYALNAHSNKTIYLYTNNASEITYQENANYATTDNYAWGFVGNSSEGYTIYNKATGKEVALNSNEPCTLSAEGVNVKWTVEQSDETSDKGRNGFCIKVPGQSYVNFQKIGEQSTGNLLRWTAKDAGSTFTPYELNFDIKTFTVHITGATGAKITYAGNQYGDGATFNAVGVAVTDITPESLTGYVCNVTINGTNIYVEYTLPPLTSMSDIVEKRIYTLESVDRGYFVYSSTNAANYISGSKKASYTFDAADTNFHFVFLQNNGKTYLYSLGAEKFATYASDGVATSEQVPSAGIDLLASTGSAKTTHPTVLRIDDSHQCNMSNDQGYGILTSWNSTGDNGNMLRILPVGELSDTELATIKEVFAQKFDFTVTITGAPEGTKITYNEAQYGNGEKISATDIAATDIIMPDVEGYSHYINVIGTSILVNYISTPDFTGKAIASIGEKTQNIQPDTWYVLTQVRGGESPAYDTGNSQQLKRANQTVEELMPSNTLAPSISKYLVRFINISGEAHMIQFGTGQFWNGVNSSTTPGTYMVYASTRGGNIGGITMNVTNDLTSYGALIDNNGKNSTIATWGSGKSTSGDNNVWYIYPVELGTAVTADVTYTYKIGDEVVGTETKQVVKDSEYPDPSTFYGYTQSAKPEGTVTANGTYTINLTWAGPFEFTTLNGSEFAESTKWYYMQNGNNNANGYVVYGNGEDKRSSMTTTSGTADTYKWCFVRKANSTAFYLYNKAAGATALHEELSSDAGYAANHNQGFCVAKTEGANDMPLVLVANGTAGYTMKLAEVSGTCILGKHVGSNLSIWGNSASVTDSGSRFTFEEALDLPEKTYAFVLTDADGNEYTGTFTSSEENAHPACVEGLALSDEVWEDGTDYGYDYIYTATIAFPFPVNTPTAISGYKGNTGGNDQFWWRAVGTDIVVKKNDAAVGNDYAWVITPNFVDNTFFYTINSYTTGKYVKVNASGSNHNQGAVTLDETANATYFTYTNDSFKVLGETLYLSVNSSNTATDQYVGVHTSIHAGSKMHYGDVTSPGIEITIGETGYATIAYMEDFVKPEGLKVYYCIDEGDEGHLTPVEWEKSYIPAYFAFILEGTPGTYSFEVTNDYEEDYPSEDYEALTALVLDNDLIGNFDDTDITVDEAKTYCGCDNIYVFSVAGTPAKPGFYTYVGSTLAAHKAFYAVNTALVSGFIVDFEGTEGINAVMSATNLKAGYDIQGRRINKVQKGINILGGKKIIK